MASQLQSENKALSSPSFMSSPSSLLQRKCACGNHTTVGGKCDKCKKQSLQRASLSPRGRGTEGKGKVPPIVHEVLRSPGQPLDVATRTFMEPHFEHDFSQVRVHTDAKAAESAKSIDALAYTVGRDIMFGISQYAPATSEGKKLLAHELTHVVQHRGADLSDLTLSDTHGQSEQEARSAASAVMGGHSVSALQQTQVQVAREEASRGGETASASAGGRALAFGQVVHVEVRADGEVEAISHEYPIDVNGYIKIPPLGLVLANGLSQDQLATNLESALANGYIVNPTVNVTLTSKIVAYGALITYPRVHLRLLSRGGNVETGSGDYPVREDGTINLPYVGRIQARDRRLDQVEEEIEALIRDGFIVEGIVHLTRQHLD